MGPTAHERTQRRRENWRVPHVQGGLEPPWRPFFPAGTPPDQSFSRFIVEGYKSRHSPKRRRPLRKKKKKREKILLNLKTFNADKCPPETLTLWTYLNARWKVLGGGHYHSRTKKIRMMHWCYFAWKPAFFSIMANRSYNARDYSIRKEITHEVSYAPPFYTHRQSHHVVIPCAVICVLSSSGSHALNADEETCVTRRRCLWSPSEAVFGQLHDARSVCFRVNHGSQSRHPSESWIDVWRPRDSRTSSCRRRTTEKCRNTRRLSRGLDGAKMQKNK